MVSFDVLSLVNDIFLMEYIHFAISSISEGSTNLNPLKTDLNKVFPIATPQTRFLFDGKVYDQIDCVAMGSPLAPMWANLSLGHYENIWLTKYQGPSIHF